MKGGVQLRNNSTRTCRCCRPTPRPPRSTPAAATPPPPAAAAAALCCTRSVRDRSTVVAAAWLATMPRRAQWDRPGGASRCVTRCLILRALSLSSLHVCATRASSLRLSSAKAAALTSSGNASHEHPLLADGGGTRAPDSCRHAACLTWSSAAAAAAALASCASQSSWVDPAVRAAAAAATVVCVVLLPAPLLAAVAAASPSKPAAPSRDSSASAAADGSPPHAASTSWIKAASPQSGYAALSAAAASGALLASLPAAEDLGCPGCSCCSRSRKKVSRERRRRLPGRAACCADNGTEPRPRRCPAPGVPSCSLPPAPLPTPPPLGASSCARSASNAARLRADETSYVSPRCRLVIKDSTPPHGDDHPLRHLDAADALAVVHQPQPAGSHCALSEKDAMRRINN
jgi:hypothetical protein